MLFFCNKFMHFNHMKFLFLNEVQDKNLFIINLIMMIIGLLIMILIGLGLIGLIINGSWYKPFKKTKKRDKNKKGNDLIK